MSKTNEDTKNIMRLIQSTLVRTGTNISTLLARTGVFALTDSEISHTSTAQMEIDTGNHPPVSS